MALWRTKLPPGHPGPGPGASGAGAKAAAVFPPDLHDSRHLRLKGVLLLVWALVSFGICFFARDLQWMVAGWPLAYWMASQGAVLVFMAIVVVYAVAMSHFEREDAQQAAASATVHAAAEDAASRREPGGG